MARVCASCGARIEPNADRCGLCGLPVDEEGEAPGESPAESDGTAEKPADAGDEPIACSACGRQNPADARFCNRCGARLGAASGVPVRSAEGGAELPGGQEGTERQASGRSPGAEVADREPSGAEVADREPSGAEVADREPSGPGAADRKAAGSGAAPSGEASAEGARMRRRVIGALLVGALLVAGLYAVTALSEGGSGGGGSAGPTAPNQSPPGTAPGGSAPQAASPGGGGSASGESAGGAGGELGAATRARIDSLTRAIEAADGERARSLREELVRVYVHAERYDRAGRVQERIAERAGTAEAWARAGNFYYDWMMRASGSTRTEYARMAVSAYQRSLDLDPEDLDVRTDMAVAYLYDPENPMQAIRQTNRVLEQDPDHVQANFNRGVMLLQIGRSDQAIDQFKKVMSMTPDTSVVHQRARQAIERVQSP